MIGGRPVTGADSLFELFDLGSPDRTDWIPDALCAQTDPEVFFPEKGCPTRAAKQVCAVCPVRVACLETALARGERFGIWGGMSERERRELSHQRQAGAERLVA